MSLRALFRRLVLPPLVAGLAVTGLALPAQAETSVGFPLLMLDITDTVTVVSGQAKTVKFDVYNLGGADAKDVRVQFGSMPLDLGFVPPAGCTATECTLDKLPAGEKHTYSFTVKPATTSNTVTSTFDVGVTAGSEEMDFVEVKVVRTTKGGVDLEISELKNLKLNRGQSVDLAPVTITNTGSAKSATLGLVLVALDGVEPDMDGYRNCERDADAGGVVCVLDQTLAAGQSASVDPKAPLKFKLRSDATGPAQYIAGVVAVGLTDKYVAAFTKRNASKTGTQLALRTNPSAEGLTDGDISDDLNPDDNAALFFVTAPTAPADSKAIGGVFKGSSGDKVTVKVGAQNLGPFASSPLSLDTLQYVHVNVPTGVKLSAVDESCLPGTSPTKLDFNGTLESRDWVCLVFDQLRKGDKALFSFTATIDDSADAAGFVQVDGGVQDTVAGNDKAALSVELGDSLPLTGPSAGLIAGAGAIILAAGLFLLRAARRRRIVTVVE